MIAEMKEEMIILLAKEGDKDAFHELYSRHRLAVFKTAFHFTRFHEDAEDIMHETFIRAFRKIHTYDLKQGAGFGAWINRICVNCSIEQLRKHKNRKLLQLEALPNPSQVPPSSEPTPEESASFSQTMQSLLKALTFLTHKQRAIFHLRYSQNMEVKEIAQCLRCSESTVKTQHMRAVSKLRRRLEPLWRQT